MAMRTFPISTTATATEVTGMGALSMRLVLFALVAALLCAACSSTMMVANGGLTDEERCLLDRGMWRAGQCQACGGGM